MAWKLVENESAKANAIRQKQAKDKMTIGLKSRGGAIAHKANKAAQGGKQEWKHPTKAGNHDDGLT